MMRMRYTVLALCVFLVLPSVARSQPKAAAENSGYEKLRLTAVAVPSFKNSQATQFLAADSKGHLLLLKGDSLEVFRLETDGSFDRRLGKLACKLASDSVYAAAMDPSGSTWALSSPADELALCDFAKEQRPPGFEWVVSSLTFSRSGPLVAVAALGPAPDVGTGLFKTKMPRVLGLADDRWQPLVWGPVPEFKAMPANPAAEIKAQTDSLICTGPKDAIWLASWNRYRLEKLSASERPEREIVVGSGNVEWQQLGKEEQEREGRGRMAEGSALIQGSFTGSVPRAIVRALLCGPRERVVYLVVSTADGLALDRFDPSQNTLERVLLDGVTTVSSGPMTAALSGGELWLGGRLAADGLWRVSLEDLVAARWKPVKDLRIDGKPVM
jgi:hypothetical protein